MPTPIERLSAAADQLVVIASELDVIRAQIDQPEPDPGPVPNPPPPDPPGPPTEPFRYDLAVDKFTLEPADGSPMRVLDEGAGTKIGHWGTAGDKATHDLRITTADTIEDMITFGVANGLAVASKRSVTLRRLRDGAVMEAGVLTIPPTGAWTNTIAVVYPIMLPEGDYRLELECETDGAYADLFGAYVTTRQRITIPATPTPGPPPPPGPTPPIGGIAAVLNSLFPSLGAEDEIRWGQNLANVPAGRVLTLRDADIAASEWIVRGLRGRPDAWITIRAENPLGFKVRELETWRGIGLFDCQYVRVDGLDGYGSGKRNPDGSGDYVSFVEGVGGHHIAATRNRAFNTGGHCVSMTMGEGMNAPANTYGLYNVALETSRRNPFNGSAFNLFHGTSKRTPDGPLAHLGYTDYWIGNVAFGCESLVAGGPWGITDGNYYILDVGNESGYDGTCLVAFGIGADNGGRGVHALHTSGLHALFNTMLGNQRTLTEPASGEYSPHGGDRHQVRGNIAAATTREPRIWYQDWQNGGGGHLVAENTVLAGDADPPNNVEINAAGLAYLQGNTTTSRDVDDYRPVTGTPLIDPDLIERFDAIAAVFPDATGRMRTQRIRGALDT